MDLSALRLTSGEQIDLVETWQGGQAQDCGTLTAIIADAQLKKALEWFHEWLQKKATSQYEDYLKVGGITPKLIQALANELSAALAAGIPKENDGPT